MLVLVSAACAGSFTGGQPPAGAGASTAPLSEQRPAQPDGAAPAPPVVTEAVAGRPFGLMTGPGASGCAGALVRQRFSRSVTVQSQLADST